MVIDKDLVGERALMMAVLVRAIKDLAGNTTEVKAYCHGKGRGLRKTAEDWIFRECGGSAPIPFESCCHALELDPVDVRRRVRMIVDSGKPLPTTTFFNFTDTVERYFF